MVSPRKEHSGATKALRKWHKRCRDPKKSADDILDLALKALDDAHGGGRALLHASTRLDAVMASAENLDQRVGDLILEVGDPDRLRDHLDRVARDDGRRVAAGARGHCAERDR